MVRSAGAYVDPGIATTTSNALMMSGEPASACAIVTRHGLIQTFAARALAACQAFAGDSAGALAAAPDLRAAEPQLAALLQSAASGQPAAGVPAGPLDGPAMVMFDLARVRPPVAALQSNDPPMIRAVVAEPLAADRDPGRGGRARRSVGDHRGDATERPLRPGGARRCRHAGGDGAARAARGCSAQRQQCGRDHAVAGRGLWRSARQPVVRHDRARERVQPAHPAGQAGVRQRRPGGDPRPAAARRSAPDPDLDEARPDLRRQQRPRDHGAGSSAAADRRRRRRHHAPPVGRKRSTAGTR